MRHDVPEPLPCQEPAGVLLQTKRTPLLLVAPAARLAGRFRNCLPGTLLLSLWAGHNAIGEGSVSYFYSPYALPRILSINAHAKFIAIVRNPLDMLPSYHQRLLFTVIEDVEDFATAWGLQEVRTRGEPIPKRCRYPHLLWYREVAKFGTQVERLYRLAGRNRFLVLLFDDLVRDPGAVYK